MSGRLVYIDPETRHTFAEYVEHTIDGPEWVRRELAYHPDRADHDRVDMLAERAAFAIRHAGCGLFLHVCGAGSPLATHGTPIRRDRTPPTITTPAVAIVDGVPTVTHRPTH